MVKLFSFFAFMYIGLTVLAFTMEGGGGLLTTSLSSSLTSSATSMNVASTSGFLTADKLVIEKEEIYYTGKTATTFTGLTRGYNGTTATAHTSGRAVYTKSASVINNLAGFNVGETAGTVGTLQLIAYAPGAMARATSQLVFGDYPFFTGSLIYLRYFYSALSIGLIMYFAYLVLSAFGGLVRR